MLDIADIKNWFEAWSKLKIVIHTQERVFYFREKELWWASLGANVGFEQNGKNEKYERPILVLRKFNKDMLWILPLTSKFRTGEYYYDLSASGYKSTVLLSQLRLISSKRLIRKIGIIPASEFIKIRNNLKYLL